MTRIRMLDPDAPEAADEIALVARSIRLTLVEVLGEARARALYDDGGLRAGEDRMRAQDMTEAVTFTDVANTPLRRLFERHGYVATRVEEGWVKQSRPLARGTGT